MTLRVPNLDDRTFQNIVDETKRRIALHCPEWTNHNLSDPGVTLVELFAYMTEQTLYRLNRVPDRLYSVFLNLVGIEPNPLIPAHTDLFFRITPQAEAATLEERIEVATQTGDAGQIVFMTNERMVLRPPELAACLTQPAHGAYTNQWDRLQFADTTIKCFDPLETDAAMYLGFAQPLSRHVIRLRIAAETLGRGIKPDEPPVSWHIYTRDGWAPARLISDGTGGLNRTGEIELALPAGHIPLTLGTVEAHWLRLTFDADTANNYSRSPEIHTVIPETIGGLVSAFHGESVETEVLGVSDGTPGQRFSLSRAPVLTPRWSGETIQVVTADSSEDWEEKEHFGYSDENDKHVVWHAASGEIEFGPQVRHPDGGTSQRGDIPDKGAEIMVTAYRVGGGILGNVGAKTLRVMRTSVPFVQGVTNLDPAVGGNDTETDEAVRLRAPMTLRSGRRAVTAGDYARLAEEASPGVARAHCIERRDGFPVVRVLIVPTVDGDPINHVIDDFVIDDVYQTVHDYLEERRLVGTRVSVGTPFYQGVSIAARVIGLPNADRKTVEQGCLRALYRYTHPTFGGPDGDGVPFGWTLSERNVRHLLTTIDGVAAVPEVVLFGADLKRERRLPIEVAAESEAKPQETAEPQAGFKLEEDHLFLGFKHSVVVE